MDTNKKIFFNDLITNKTIEDKVVKINDKEVIVKQYLPVNQKLSLITNILSILSENVYSFCNTVQMEVLYNIYMIKYYTNIEIADDASPADILDTLIKEDILESIMVAIPVKEKLEVHDGMESIIEAAYKYRNSALGIFETISKDYSNLNLDTKEMEENISNPENLALLKDIVTKLG